MELNKTKVKKILIIKLKGIGDVILSSVVFDNLLRDFPDAAIDYLTEPPSRTALENLPFLNEILILDKKSRFGSLSVIREVRKRKYDLVFDFYANPRTALITFLSGAPYRAGFPYRGRTYAYNLFGPPERGRYHAARLHLEFLKKLNISSRSETMYFGTGDADREFAAGFFNENFSGGTPVIGISPSGGWPSKKCDPEKFAEIGDMLCSRYNVRLLLVWGPGDKEEAFRIESMMKNKVIMAPPTSLREMAALLGRCTLVVANDSGPMHIAVAMRTPVLGLFGPTSPEMQGPFGEQNAYYRNEKPDCIGCNLLVCNRKHECFLDMDTEEVLNKTEELIKKNGIKIPLRQA